ncbi:MAG: alpha-2-macroglobulin, partial [Spirochaetes bacterium]|nr:alpha-2-macroglobulin [Spirochaetota bacterium]
MMKTKNLVFCILLLTIAITFACQRGEIPNRIFTADEFISAASNGNSPRFANDAAIEAAFTLDFRPQRAEPVQEAEFLSAAELAGASRANAGRGTTVGGGLRPLANYLTTYFDPAAERSRIEAIRAAQEAGRAGQIESADAGPLTVIDWGPRGVFTSAVQRPSIHVMFSQPMIPVATLGEQSSTSPIVSIYPAVRGVFRWYGTGFLSFEGAEPLQSQQIYTITVSENATSIFGTRISGERVFTFVTETLSMRNIAPGGEWRGNAPRLGTQNISPETARQIGIEFNYPIEANHIAQHLEIRAGDTSKRFTLRQAGERRVIATLADPVDFNTEIRVTLLQGARSRGGTRGTEVAQTRSFRTPGIFSVSNHRRLSGGTRFRNLVEINFTHDLNIATVERAISTEPAMPISSENIEVWGSTVRLFNLPVGYGDRFRVLVSQNIEDVFGRNLSAAWAGNVQMPTEPPPIGYARFLHSHSTHAMLEAQFPPRFLFEYRNIAPNSWYSLTSNLNHFRTRPRPWDRGGAWLADPPGAARFYLTPGTVNARYFEEIDLSPYLNSQGRGFVTFMANLELLTRERQRDGTYTAGTRPARNELNIQVTDLGLTVRYGFNRAVVMVTSLSTGQPVEGALVRLISPRQVTRGDLMTLEELVALNDFGNALTDRNGLAVIPLNASVLRNNVAEQWALNTPFVLAEKDGDRAIFTPRDHSSWRFGISSRQARRAEEVRAVAFMFSDRGLYKPGEVISFRGVDRSKVLGMYTIYQGDYIITLEETGHRPSTIATLEGTTTESGSFFGTINIPEDLTPGAYQLVYRRRGSQAIVATTPITVAFFERLRFQATLSAPPVAVIRGDDINLNLRATYLAGGSLSGASWESAWTREMFTFQPRGAETRGFTFGPRRVWDARRHIGSESGVLSGQGTATLSQATGGGNVVGAAYIYRAEARVTDIGNQMVTAFRSVVVHPASFYIGLSRSGSGFARAGQDITFNYITVNPDGERFSGNQLFLQSGENARQLSVELIREEWRRVQQRGVNNQIHDTFSPELVTDSVQQIAIGRDNSGTIRVRPSVAGFYILRVSSQDREGRTALTELNFHVTGAGSGFWNMTNPDELRLIPDQEMYEPGDTARILLQSTLPAGRYLITVEREGIFTQEVRHFTEPVSIIEIPIARNYVPVVYVSVASYSVRTGPPTHEYGTPDLDKPRGFFGMTRLRVDPRTRAFSINVESDRRTYRPGEEVTMTLTATRGGRPLANAELSLMVVDRGVLDLINYRVPCPISHFYAEERFPLFVHGGDSRSWLMDPVTYSVRNLAGGDAEGESKLEERKDFNPTAVFEPMLITDANGRVTTTFRLPDNLTTYRVTVFGVQGDLFALRETEIAAQNKINVRQVIPRRMRERDTSEVGVLLTNLDSVSHTMTVRLDIGPPLPDDEASGRRKVPGQAVVDGIAERRVVVRSGENAMVFFDVAAVQQGFVGLNFTITSNVLNERLIQELQIERSFVFETFTTIGTIRGDSHAEGLVIPSFADHGEGSLSVILDATRLGLLDSAITTLFHYPFGCLEQRAAVILPLVVFGEYIDSLGLRSEVANPQRVVENELRSWAQIQLSNGGFPFWPSGTRAHFYVSLRIAHVIAIAQSKGMNIPASLNIPALRAYLDREFQEVQRWQRASRSFWYQSYLQSFKLYVMAQLGERIDPARLAEILTRDNVDASVLSFVGLTYRTLGMNTEAAAVAQRLRNLMLMTARGVDIVDPLERNRFNFFGGSVEQLANSLRFFAWQFPGDDINTRLLFSLLENKRASPSRGFWVSTAVTARVLLGVDALIRAENLQNIDVSATASLAGTELLQGSFRGLGAKPVMESFHFRE